MISPYFSLVVPTLNRSIELNALLESLREQSLSDFEVIIVDQNNTLDLSSIIDAYNDDLIIKHIKTSKRGASTARNIGIEIARGQIINFPDDDCEFPNGLLTKVKNIFSGENPPDGITVSSKDRSGHGGIARLSSKGGKIHKYNVLKNSVEFGIFVNREALGAIRFNEDLGVGASTPWWSDEGPDLVLRMINNGKKIHYFNNLFIYHPNPIKTYNSKTIERSYKYGNGRGRFLKIHHYNIFYVTYIWSLYLAGSLVSLFTFKYQKFRYYFRGLQGRIEGYLS